MRAPAESASLHSITSQQHKAASMSKRTVVEWSPHDASLFAVGADNLRLFEISTSSSSSGGNGSSSAPAASAQATTQRKRSFRVVKINAKVAQLKCLEWYPFASKPLLIAAGTGSGKVVLSDFQDPRARAAREFLPKYSRPCHAVAWNRAAPNQLAAGFEKVRSDFCTLVWDLNTAAGVAGAGANGSAAASEAAGNGGSSEAMSDGEGALESSRSARKSGLSSGGGVGNVGGVSVGVGSGGSLAAANSKPVHELSNSEATLALSWVPLQPTCLATGTGFKWLRIYDLRSKSSPLSVVAHNKGVLGVAFDEHRPNILATFSDSPQEPVKVWDIRQLESSTGPLLTIQQTSKNLSQVSWCPSKPGILVTASADEKWISLWDIASHETGASDVLRKPFRRRYTSEALTSFSWQNVESRNQPRRSAASSSKNLVTAAAFPNRLLTASVSGEIEDISVHDSMPVTMSSTGAIAFSCGKLLFGGIPNGPGLGTATSSRLALDADIGMNAVVDDDISSQMYKLAKTGYSIVLSKNLKLFSDRTPRERQLRQLWLWVDQVEALRRIQASRIAQSKTSNGAGGSVSNVANAGALRGWPFDPNVLVNVGVKNLLIASSSPGDVTGGWEAVGEEEQASRQPSPKIASLMKTDPVLGCQYFEGLGRRLSVLACNWDPDCGQGVARSSSVGAQGFENAPGRGQLPLHKSNSGVWNPQKQPFDDGASALHRSWNENARYELSNILSRCEMDGRYDRAAAIAVFHGDLNSAVSYLQKGAMWLSQSQHLNIGITSAYSSDVLQLAAMAVAGYSSSTVSPAGQALWSGMCQQLLKRDEIVSTSQPRYLHAMLAFLCAASASATTSSSSRASQPQPPRRGNSRRQWGSVDGLSGMNSAKPVPAGSYSAILTDSTLPLSDRVAFACRYLAEDDLRNYILQLEDESERFGRLQGLVITGLNEVGVRLLQKYLDGTGDIQTLALLAARLPAAQMTRTQPMDKWIQIYKDLLNRWQLFHERARFDVGRAQLEDLLNGFASFSRDPDGEELGAELSPPSSTSVPPQLFVRCNFCNTTLSLASLLRLGGSHSSWLNRTKPKLSCCPTCRKPLPQCALCLLPFGSLNPYFELAHRRSKHTAETVNALVSAAGESGSVLKDPKSGKSEYENLAQLSSIPFVEWFTWCQSCKHGGHAHHIDEWFSSHSVCPVTDCDCKCQFLDSPIMLNEKQNERLAQQQRTAAAAASAAGTAAAAKAAQRQTSSTKRQQPQQPSDNAPAMHRNAKTFQQQSVFQSDRHAHLSASATIGPAAPSYRTATSAQLRPSAASSSGLPPFSLSGSTSASMLNLSGSTGAGSNSAGSGGGKDNALAMGRALGNKLDQLEKEGSYMQYM